MAPDLPPSRLLLVEGADDEHVVRHLCSREPSIPDFAIDDKKGFLRLREILRAQIHAWLATRKEPRKMAAAIGAGDLNAKDPLATQFVDWLRRLFS